MFWFVIASLAQPGVAISQESRWIANKPALSKGEGSRAPRNDNQKCAPLVRRE
jgi:hypothetical protein